MPKSFHAIAIAAATSAGLLMLSASPSLACYATATPCTELAPQPQPQIEHRGGRLYDAVPRGSTANSLRPSTPYHFPRPAPAAQNSK
jgi:hypothetical protein